MRPSALGIPVFVTTILVCSGAWADSPLTSTGFSSEYMDLEIVREAQTQGLSVSVVELVLDTNTPLDVVAATINAVGWQGSSRAPVLAESIAVAHGTTVDGLELAELSANEALALGYLASLDDYFDLSAIGGGGEVGDATPEALLDRAVDAAPGDRTALLIRGLIRAQDAMDESWCDVWTGVEQASEAGVTGGLRDDAVTVVMDYIGLYQSSCPLEATLPTDPHGHGGGILGGH